MYLIYVNIFEEKYYENFVVIVVVVIKTCFVPIASFYYLMNRLANKEPKNNIE